MTLQFSHWKREGLSDEWVFTSFLNVTSLTEYHKAYLKRSARGEYIFALKSIFKDRCPIQLHKGLSWDCNCTLCSPIKVQTSSTLGDKCVAIEPELKLRLFKVAGSKHDLFLTFTKCFQCLNQTSTNTVTTLIWKLKRKNQSLDNLTSFPAANTAAGCLRIQELRSRC